MPRKNQHLITCKDDLIQNLDTIESYLNWQSNEEDHQEMLGYIKRGKVFVAYKIKETYHFAPSRFVGYKSNTLEKHRINRSNQKVDGRKTTPAISKLLESTNLQNENINSHFINFCALLDIKPNQKERTFWILDEDIHDDMTNEALSEGSLHMRHHLRKDRNQKAVRLAKKLFKNEHDGKLFCEICSFDFYSTYGPIGKDFIEAHHIIPLSSRHGKYEVSAKDYMMVCPNCHRILHRSGYTTEKLKEVLENK